MPCNPVSGKTPDGDRYSGFACSRGKRARPKPCKTPGCAGVDEILCDWPTGAGKTCDLAICRRCAVRVGPNMDYCPAHYIESKGPANEESRP